MIAFIFWFSVAVISGIVLFYSWKEFPPEIKASVLKTIKIGVTIASIISLVIFIIVSLF